MENATDIKKKKEQLLIYFVFILNRFICIAFLSIFYFQFPPFPSYIQDIALLMINPMHFGRGMDRTVNASQDQTAMPDMGMKTPSPAPSPMPATMADATPVASNSTLISTMLQLVMVMVQLIAQGGSGGANPFSLPQAQAMPDITAQNMAATQALPTAMSSGNPPALTAVNQAGAPPATQPANSISVKDFGAVGDGKADDQMALQKAFDEAKATGKTVWLPPGTYNHSGVLTIDGSKVTGAGDSSVLHATNPDQGAIRLTGDNSALANIQTTVMAPSRSSMPNAAAVLIQNASNASVSRVRVQGASSNGIRVDNASGSRIFNNLVLGTNADGIALMNGAGHNLVQGNVVYQAGDDSYSDDSYTSDAKQDDGNVFDGNLSLDNAYGRGIALAGSKNATVRNNVVSGSRWIGIWGDGDPNSGTMQSSGHSITNNTVINNPNGAPVQSNGPGGAVSGTITTGSVPNLASILGWDPGALPDRSAFNSVYKPGTGSGANNTAGNRT